MFNTQERHFGGQDIVSYLYVKPHLLENLFQKGGHVIEDDEASMDAEMLNGQKNFPMICT